MSRDHAAYLGATLAALPILTGLAIAAWRITVLGAAAIRETWPGVRPAPVLLTLGGIALIVTAAALIAQGR